MKDPQDPEKLSFLHIRDLPPEYKSQWVRQAQKEGLKLTDWAIKTLNKACSGKTDE